MKQLLRTLSVGAILIASAMPIHAQINFPAASPAATVKQVVGLTNFEIEYSRPSVKGREIFGGLVPYGEVWRTGANAPTKITFSDSVELGGEKIPAGTYALYTIPTKDEWTVIVYGSTEGWGSIGYDQSKDVARVKAKPTKLDHAVESFTIGIDALRNDSAVLYLDWDHTRVAVPIKVPTNERVMSQIDSLKDKPEFQNPNTLFGAASYYHESGYNLPQALAWVTAAVEKNENPAFWMYARKARIEVDLGKKDAAMASAKTTLDLATKAGNGDYQKIARDIIASL